MATRRLSTKPKAPAARSRSTAKVPGISRIDQASTRTFGWFCRVGYRPTPTGTRPKFTAFFGDASNGGKKKAYNRAVLWLKTVERTGKAPKKK